MVFYSKHLWNSMYKTLFEHFRVFDENKKKNLWQTLNYIFGFFYQAKRFLSPKMTYDVSPSRKIILNNFFFYPYLYTIYNYIILVMFNLIIFVGHKYVFVYNYYLFIYLKLFLFYFIIRYLPMNKVSIIMFISINRHYCL